MAAASPSFLSPTTEQSSALENEPTAKVSTKQGPQQAELPLPWVGVRLYWGTRSCFCEFSASGCCLVVCLSSVLIRERGVHGGAERVSLEGSAADNLSCMEDQEELYSQDGGSVDITKSDVEFRHALEGLVQLRASSTPTLGQAEDGVGRHHQATVGAGTTRLPGVALVKVRMPVRRWEGVQHATSRLHGGPKKKCS